MIKYNMKFMDNCVISFCEDLKNKMFLKHLDYIFKKKEEYQSNNKFYLKILVDFNYLQVSFSIYE